MLFIRGFRRFYTDSISLVWSACHILTFTLDWLYGTTATIALKQS